MPSVSCLLPGEASQPAGYLGSCGDNRPRAARTFFVSLSSVKRCVNKASQGQPRRTAGSRANRHIG